METVELVEVATEAVSAVTESVMDKAVTHREVAVVTGIVVGGTVLYKLGKYAWKRFGSKDPEVVVSPGI